MLRRAYLLNAVVSAIGTLACMAIVPSKSEILAGIGNRFEAAAQNSALLGPIVFRTITPFSR
jgi:hypothetical protein